MLLKYLNKATFAGLAFTYGAVVLPTIATATDFTAGVVMEKMPAQERYPYVSGLIEGVAYARYLRDGKQADGMLCIYDWFYKDQNSLELIYAAFGQYPKFTPAAIVTSLADRKCPKS